MRTIVPVLLWFGLLLFSPVSAFDGKLSQTSTLDENGNFVLLWTPLENEIVFEVQVKTRGYVGLGFSPNGGMTGADIVIGWVNDNAEVFLQDYHGISETTPIIDEIQDYNLINGFKNDTHTVLRFSRPYHTCDKENDFPITRETSRVIWAYHSEFPDPAAGRGMKQHEARGHPSLLLRQATREITTGTTTWDIKAQDVEIPETLDTLYWCKLYKIPKLERKHHIIAFEPIIAKGNYDLVHHMLLYECIVPESSRYLDRYSNHRGTQCYTKNMPISWLSCLKNALLIYGPGSPEFSLPEHAGIPIGEEHGGATYFLLEIHYDNPKLEKGLVDNSGLRLILTDELRQFDAGTLMVGASFEPPTLAVPPNVINWDSVHYCAGECTEKGLPESGIQVFSVMLHAHLIGKGIKVQHIRDEKELPTLSIDRNYDFNYQQSHYLVEERKVLPGDSFFVTCTYNSIERRLPTFGGLSTNEEMCLAFFGYYPRVEMSECLSTVPMEPFLEGLGLEVANLGKFKKNIGAKYSYDLVKKLDDQHFERLNSINKNEGDYKGVKFAKQLHRLKIDKPAAWKGKSVYEFIMNEENWRDLNLAQRYRNLTTSRFAMQCGKRDRTPILDKDDEEVPFPYFTPYEEPKLECVEGVVLTSEERARIDGI